MLLPHYRQYAGPAGCKVGCRRAVAQPVIPPLENCWLSPASNNRGAAHRAGAYVSDDKIRDKAEGVLRDARSRFGGDVDLKQQARDKASQAVQYVKDNPWHGIGAGAAVGIVLGVLLGRR